MHAGAQASRRVGKFLVLEKLGAGSMGTVYLAKDLERDQHVAVKFLHHRLASDPDIVARLRADACAANQIDDPHVAGVLEVGCIGQQGHYISMEYLDGEPLSHRLGRPLGVQTAVTIARQICSALQAAHQHGVVHRDLKPDNIFLLSPAAPVPFVKVLDFGIAKLLRPRPGSPRTSSGQICGTPQYMAPEQCTGRGVDRRTDLYALGIITYELVTGRVPFDGRNLVDVMMRQRNERPVPPCEVESTVPRALSEVIMRALAKRPDERFATAAQMSEALARVRGQGPVPELQAEVRAPGGPRLMLARCTQLLSGGLFLSTDEKPPPLGEPLEVVLHLDGLQIDCACQVTMHVDREQAVAYGTPRGFAARFTRLDPAAQALVDRLLRGEPLPRKATPPELLSLAVPAQQRGGEDDLYALLGLPSSADLGTVRRRARECRSRLEEALLASTEPKARVALNRTLERTDEAARVLGDAALRVEYDAARGNFRGVAMCLDAGLDPEHLAACRARYSEAFSAAMVASRVHANAAQAQSMRGAHRLALAECELALTLDPLSARLHQMRVSLTVAVEGAPETLSGEWRIHRETRAPGQPPPGDDAPMRR
jgi:serine/threonine-protein kinase